MDDKKLVYLDKELADHAKGDYLRVANRVQKIIDFLKSHDMKCDIEHAKEIIENNSMAECFVKNGTPGIQEKLPEVIRKLIDNNIDKVINELKKIALEARESITNNSYHKVDYSKLKMEDGKVMLSHEALKESHDFGAVYIDTPTRGNVYNCAQIALKALENLQKSIDEAEKKGTVTGYPFYAINRNLSQGWGLPFLIISADGKIHLNNEAFRSIV